MSIRERIKQKVKTFNVGDTITTAIDNDVVVVGTLISISSQHGKVETRYGTFNCWLAIAEKVDTQERANEVYIMENPPNETIPRRSYGSNRSR